MHYLIYSSNVSSKEERYEAILKQKMKRFVHSSQTNEINSSSFNSHRISGRQGIEFETAT